MKPQKHRIRAETIRNLQLRAVESTGLPAGCCASIVAVGLRYNEPDYYGTIFKPGCLAKTSAKVAGGKVKFYADHIYKTKSHIGVVRSLEDVNMDVLVRADVLDTESGRDYAEYAKACLAASAQTGLSIGFWDRASEIVEMNGERYLAYTEVELEEFSATPANAVEGADLLSARRLPDGDRRASMLSITERLLATLPEADARALLEARCKLTEPGNAEPEAASAPSATPPASDSQPAGAIPALATREQRMSALRQSYALR